jgi:NAD(P)-dependent dehydrogenase (short-subunit alcohol dehydrogenase family)
MVMTAQLDRQLEQPFALEGRRILITGAAGGIGNAAAEICAWQGAEIIRTDILTKAAAHARMSQLPGDYHQVDLSDRAAVSALADASGPVWAVIDTAGICPVDDWMEDAWERAFDQVIDVNLRAPINLARAYLPLMIKQGGGRFALCGSVSGRMGGVVCGPHYAASKGGLHSFTRWLAQKGTPHNVLVNAVAPGSVDTPMAAQNNVDTSGYPQGRGGRPRELGATLAFLCTPGAGFISGVVLDVNGGTYFG